MLGSMTRIDIWPRVILRPDSVVCQGGNIFLAGFSLLPRRLKKSMGSGLGFTSDLLGSRLNLP